MEPLGGVDRLPLPYPSVSDGVVRLRPLAEDDVDALVRAVADPLIPRFTFWPGSLSRDEATARVRRAEACRMTGTRLEVAIADVNGDELLGFIGFQPEWRERRGTVFYWTVAWARSRGVARRALSLLAHWAFEELPVDRLELEVDADNIASQRVAEAAGFQREGLLRARRLRPDGRCDSIFYGLLR